MEFCNAGSFHRFHHLLSLGKFYPMNFIPCVNDYIISDSYEAWWLAQIECNFILPVFYFLFSWSRKLIERASKTQYVDLPSVNLNELRERGIIVRCANFSVEALRSAENEKNRSHSGKSAPKLPIITSDKKTFNIPDDVYNPAFQVSMTLYHYPDKCGTKFLCEFKV